MNDQLRKCKTCGVEYPKTKEWFGTLNNQNQFDTVCKTCKSIWAKEYYSTHPRPVTEYWQGKGYMLRQVKRKNIWKLYTNRPWKYIMEFETLEEGKKWVEDNG